jgi:hypothetical protein
MSVPQFKGYLSKILRERGLEIPWYVASGAMVLGAVALYPESPEYILMGVASALCIGTGVAFGKWWRKSGYDKKLQL